MSSLLESHRGGLPQSAASHGQIGPQHLSWATEGAYQFEAVRQDSGALLVQLVSGWDLHLRSYVFTLSTPASLFQLYSATTKLTGELSKFNLGSDHLFLTNLTKDIFRGYLDNYINIECRYLNERCTLILRRYYEKKGHQKKKTFGFASRLEGQAKTLASKANINLDTVSYGGETFLSSEEVAINILQLTKEAFRWVLHIKWSSNSSLMAFFSIQTLSNTVQCQGHSWQRCGNLWHSCQLPPA